MSAPRFRVLVADKLSKEGLARLEHDARIEVVVKTGLDPAALAVAVSDADALLVRSAVKIDAAVLSGARRLRVIGRAGIGVDNIDVDAATRRGILVMNSPDANANTTAEHALALIFALARSVPAADASVRAGRWERSAFVGTELQGKTLGVLGGGNIGRRVARKAKALGLEVVVHDPFLKKDALADERIEVVGLDDFLRRADIVTVHVPKMAETANLLDARMFARMKKGVRIINCARGGIVNEADLLAALDAGQVAGAALDVFEQEPPPAGHPFFARRDVVLTPHLGASTAEAQERASAEICAQVRDYLVGGVIVNAVNLPRVPPETLAEMAPWIDLAERLGLILASLARGPAESLTITFNGALASSETALLSRAFTAGLLGARGDESVNLVNAPTLAASRGITISEERNARIRDFDSMLCGTLSCGAESVAVAGTLFGLRQPRLVKIDEFRLDVIPEGALLVVRNVDRPGVVGRLGTALGDRGINIRGMGLAPPVADGGPALAVLNLSGEADAATLEAVRALEDVQCAIMIALDEGKRP